MKNMPEAEDVLQDTLIQFVRTKPVFERENHKKAWLLRVASNIYKNKLKSSYCAKTDGIEEEYPCEDMNEELKFVWEAEKKLDEKYRIVIHLYYQEGYSTAEIPKVTEKKNLQYALFCKEEERY